MTLAAIETSEGNAVASERVRASSMGRERWLARARWHWDHSACLAPRRARTTVQALSTHQAHSFTIHSASSLIGVRHNSPHYSPSERSAQRDRQSVALLSVCKTKWCSLLHQGQWNTYAQRTHRTWSHDPHKGNTRATVSNFLIGYFPSNI